MARYKFGGTLFDFVDSSTKIQNIDVLAPTAATVTLWTAKTGGTQITDLQDSSGSAITTVAVQSDGNIPDFYGPDGVTSMYASADGGARLAIVSWHAAADAVAASEAAAANSATSETSAASSAAAAQAAAQQATAPTDSMVASLVPASSGSATSAQLSAAFAARPGQVVPTWTDLPDYGGRPTRPAIVAIGDSLTDNNQTSTQWNGSSSSRTAAFRGDGYLSRAMIYGRQPCTWYDVGVSGQTAAQGLARFDTDVTPLKPQIVIEAFGTNDIAADRTASDTFNDKYAMWQKAWAFGAHVIATTCPPRNTFSATEEQESQRLNAMLRAYASTNPRAFTLVDWWTVLGDPVTGDYITTIHDAAGVHPNSAGALALAPLFADAIAKIVPNGPTSLALTGVNDPDNLVADPLFLAAGGSITANKGLTGTSRSGWTATSTGTDATLTSVLSQPARTDGYGNWFQIATSLSPSGADYVGLNKTLTGWSVGDMVQLSIDFETDAAGWTDGKLDAELLCVDGATIYHIGVAQSGGADGAYPFGRQASGVLQTPPIEIPPNTSVLRASLIVGGQGTVRFGRIKVRKLPTT